MTGSTPARTADHWWWRPGWAPGRTFYTWHVTFAGQPRVHTLAQLYRDALAPVTGLDLVPDQWLHLTMQGLGFTDEVNTSDVDAIVTRTRQHLARIPAFTVEVDRPSFTPEAIRWDVTGPVAQVRDAVRAAIAAVWSHVPEPSDGFQAHITIAYANSDGPAAPALKAIASVPSRPTIASISSAELIVLNRDQQMYQWQPYASATLGGP